MEVINRFRRGLNSTINAEVLGRIGITESLVPRTLQTLQVLELIDEKGTATTTLEGLRRAPEQEFPVRLTEWLNRVYADVLLYIDPATANKGAILDAFRSYNPVAQQPRMVSLFTGLYAAAGVRKAETTESASVRVAGRKAAVRRLLARPVATTTLTVPVHTAHTTGLPSAISGLLSNLPKSGQGWPKARRDQFLATFGAVLDFCFPIQEQEGETASDDVG